MHKHEIITVMNNSVRSQQILDTDLPVGFEVEVMRIKKLNQEILNIISGHETEFCEDSKCECVCHE